MSFSASHRDACRTMGTSAGGGGPVWFRSTRRLIRPGAPSRRENMAGGWPVPPSRRPTCWSECRTSGPLIGSFLAEKGSIEGAMTDSRSREIHGGANCSQENTNAGTSSRYGRRKSHPRCGVLVLLVEPDVASPHHADAGFQQRWGQAGGLRIVEEDDVAGSDERRPARRRWGRASPRSRWCSDGPSGPPSPGMP